MAINFGSWVASRDGLKENSLRISNDFTINPNYWIISYLDTHIAIVDDIKGVVFIVNNAVMISPIKELIEEYNGDVNLIQLSIPSFIASEAGYTKHLVVRNVRTI